MQKPNLMFRRIAPWVLTGSLVAMSAAAEDLKRVVEKQQEILKKVTESALSPKPDCPSAVGQKSAESLLRECVQAVCPSDGNHIDAEAIQKQVQERATQNLGAHFADIQDVLKSWASAGIADARSGMDALQKLIASNHLKVDPKYQPLHNLTFLLTFAGDTVMSGQSTADHLVVDAQKTSAKHPELPKEDQEWLAKALEGFYNLPETRFFLAASQSSNSGADVLKMKYPDLSLKEALSRLADELDHASSALTKKSNELGLPPAVFSNVLVPHGMIESARAGKIESEESLEAFLKMALMDLSFLSVATQPEKYPWLSGRSPDAFAELNKKGILSKRMQEMQAYIKGSKFLDELGTVVENCVSSYSLNAEALPTEKELSEAKKRADGVIAAFQSKAFNRLSQHTAAMLSETFKEIQVFFPRSFAAYRDDYISQFKNDTLSSNASIQLRRSHPGDAGAQFALFNVYGLLGSDWSPTSSMLANFNQCDRFALKDVNDRAVPSEKVFWSSWFSVKNPHFGRAVMAHELGHVMDGALAHGDVSAESAAKYQAIQNCLKPKHPEAALDFTEQSITAEGQTFEYDAGKYSVEDFADQIAAMVIPETNLGCLLIDSNDRAKPSLIYDSPTDIPHHSSDVYRALFSEQIRKGKLPKVCQDALAGEDMSRDFSSCFK